jgi:hypothetical protein
MSENKMSTGTRSLRGAPKGEKDWMGDVSVLKRQNRTTPHDLLCLPKMKMSFLEQAEKPCWQNDITPE